MVDYSSEVQKLPMQLRADARRYFDAGDHGSIAVLLKDHLNRGGTRSPETLVVLACAIFMDAFEVMVDRVTSACREALALLSEIEDTSPSNSLVPFYHRQIQGVLLESIARELAEAAEASMAITAGEATAEQLATAAHRAWKKHQPRIAADLFLQAARREVAEASARSRWAAPDKSMNYIVRAGKCLFEAGEHERALPLLEQATVFDWRAGRLWADRHTTQWAFGAMLEDSATSGDWTAFDATWVSALSRCDELQMQFPSVHPIQERLLDLCLDAHEDSYLPHLVRVIEAREKRLPRDLIDRLQRAKNRIDN